MIRPEPGLRLINEYGFADERLLLIHGIAFFKAATKCVDRCGSVGISYMNFSKAFDKFHMQD